MEIKQYARNTEGDLYQIWLGVSIIKDWILFKHNIDKREKFWLEQEIGSSNAGVFENDEYQFYQVLSLAGILIHKVKCKI